MNRKWIIKATGLAAGVAIFASACGQALDDPNPGLESTGTALPGIQEPSGDRDGIVVPNPTEDQHGDTVTIDNPDLDNIKGGPVPSGTQGASTIEPGVLLRITDGPVIDPVPPVTIIDNLDPTECNLVHSINGCFVDGQPPTEIPLDEYLGLFAAAHEDAVMRFGADPGTTRLAKIGRVEWPDSSLGKPQPGLSYAQVITPGFKMLLSSAEQTFLYHTSLQQVVPVEVTEAIAVPPLPPPASLPPIEESSSQENDASVATRPADIILEETEPEKTGVAGDVPGHILAP